MRERHEDWLLKELPMLEEQGILSEYYAQALREHYASTGEERQRRPILRLIANFRWERESL